MGCSEAYTVCKAYSVGKSLAFTTIKPMPGVVGGKIEPIWEAPRPDWLTDRLAASLTILDWSDTPIFLCDNQRWLAGANIAYPRKLLAEMNGFSTNLGRKGKWLLSCEENLLNAKISDRGYSLCYYPEAIVKHHIQPNRLVKSWHIKRQYWNGFSNSLVHCYSVNLPWFDRLRKVYFLIKQDTFQISKSLLFSLFKQIFEPISHQDKLFEDNCNFMVNIGAIHGFLSFKNCAK